MMPTGTKGRQNQIIPNTKKHFKMLKGMYNIWGCSFVETYMLIADSSQNMRTYYIISV